MFSSPETPYEQSRIDALAKAVATVAGVDEAYLIEVEMRGWKGTKLLLVPAVDKLAAEVEDACRQLVPEQYLVPSCSASCRPRNAPSGRWFTDRRHSLKRRQSPGGSSGNRVPSAGRQRPRGALLRPSDVLSERRIVPMGRINGWCLWCLRLWGVGQTFVSASRRAADRNVCPTI